MNGTMLDQFVETWHINNRINLTLLDEINEEGLNVTLSKQGAETPAKQFAHMHNVRLWKLEKMDAKLVQDLEKLSLKKELNRDLLRFKLIRSAEAIGNLLKNGFENGGEIERYHCGVFTFMGYLISHEAHHRGKMMLTLKQCGYDLSKSVKYGIWDWNKI